MNTNSDINPDQLHTPHTVKTGTHRSPGLSGTTIKIIAAITMLIDHTGYAVIRHLPDMADNTSRTYYTYAAMRLIGRLAFPLYIFLLVEGFRHTRSRVKYAVRMLIFCPISEIPFDLAFFKFNDMEHQNVYFTLFIGLIMMCGFELMQKKWVDTIDSKLIRAASFILPCAGFTYVALNYLPQKLPYDIPKLTLAMIVIIICEILVPSLIASCSGSFGSRTALILAGDLSILAVCAAIASLLKTDYGYAGIFAIAVMYICRQNEIRGMMGSVAVLTALSSTSEIFAIVDVPLLYKYNGKRGIGLKFFFYFFYPVHLIILYLIARHLGLK